MQAYERIKATEGNFSEWFSNLLISYDSDKENGPVRMQRLIDALRRRNKVIINELKLLYSNNGVVRKELQKDCYPILEGICLGDDI